VSDSTLVEPLSYTPVVYTNVSNHQTDWLQPAADFFDDPAQYDLVRAASGPSDWPRFTIPELAKSNPNEIARLRAAAQKNGTSFQDPTIPDPPKVALPPVHVANIATSDDSVSFDVDQVGVPVLVKTSYFPNWKVSGGKGPYRVTPNFMVVIPTSTHVKLHYGYVGVDLLGWGLTFVGIALLVVLFLRPSGPMHPPWWDPIGRAFRRRPQARRYQPDDDDWTDWPPDPEPDRVGVGIPTTVT
jgi:hypothetical protein